MTSTARKPHLIPVGLYYSGSIMGLHLRALSAKLVRVGNYWYWLGHQGWEYVETGKLWQVLLLVVFVLLAVTLYRGVYTVPFDIHEVRPTELFRAILTLLLQLELVEKGDMVIVTKGELAGITGGTNALTILRVPQD